MASRVAVIGAGHHGLVAAVRLAEHGRHVRVFEIADRPGGAVRSAELTLPGFVHDTCSGFFPLAAASPVFRQLDLGLDWVNPPVPMVHPLDEQGREIALHRDLGATARSLDACAPGAGAGWKELVQTLWPHRDLLIRAGLARLPPVRDGLALLARLRGEAIELAPLAVRSSATLGRTVLGDDRATAWLAGSGSHADLSPQTAGSGAFALGLNFLGHVVGWPFPRGGAGRLTDALVARLRQAGGELRCGAPVTTIELRGRRVVAVRLRDGERVPIDGVICTTSPRPLLAMLPPGALPGRLERRLRGWRYGLGTLKLDYALSSPVPWLGKRAREAAVVHVGGGLEDLVNSLAQAGNGRFPEQPALVVGQQSLHDRSRAPEGAQTLYVYARVPQRPRLADDEMAARVEAQIERFAPGFSPAGPGAVGALAGGDRSGEPEPGWRRSRRRKLRARPASRVPSGAGPVSRAHAHPRPLRRRWLGSSRPGRPWGLGLGGRAGPDQRHTGEAAMIGRIVSTASAASEALISALPLAPAELSQSRVLVQDAHRPWPVPDPRWLMAQTWRDLLFAHWPVTPDLVRQALPAALPLDTFEGSAWIGISPFELSGLRPRGGLPLPGTSRFPELNVRTYTTLDGKPGIYFFSLDAANLLAVIAARRGYRLPYFQAQMGIERRASTIHYRSRRKGSDHGPARFEAEYRPVGEVIHAEPGTLEHFVTERYCLYTVNETGRPLRGEIHHPPWPLQRAEASISANTMTLPLGIELPRRTPVLHFSRLQNVVIWPLRAAGA